MGGIEGTAYAMLAIMSDNPSNIQTVLPYLRWLVKQLGKNGGFKSTQVNPHSLSVHKQDMENESSRTTQNRSLQDNISINSSSEIAL